MSVPRRHTNTDLAVFHDPLAHPNVSFMSSAISLFSRLILDWKNVTRAHGSAK